MVNWLIVLFIIAAIFLVSRFIHFRNLKHKIFVIFVILLLGFFVLTFLSVVKSNALSIKNASDFFSAGKLYFSWLGHIFDNIKVLTGNAIKMEWFNNRTG